MPERLRLGERRVGQVVDELGDTGRPGPAPALPVGSGAVLENVVDKGELLADAEYLLSRCLVVEELVRREQDVPRSDLVDELGLRRVARLPASALPHGEERRVGPQHPPHDAPHLIQLLPRSIEPGTAAEAMAQVRRVIRKHLGRPTLSLPDVAIRALHALGRPDALLLVVGGASGNEGDGEVDRAHQLVDELGLHDQVRFVEPQPHHILSTYYRAADVVVVPSRSESFGLVALEAAACGIPVVASAVGGLQSLVDHGDTGFLIDQRDPARFAKAIAAILDDPLLAASMSVAAAERAQRYTWGFAAARLRRLYADLTTRQLVVGE